MLITSIKRKMELVLYDKWNEIKKEISNKENKRVKVGKIYWVHIGYNIGSEVYGKGKEFVRPVLVVKQINNIGLFLGIPLSSKNNKLYYKFTDSKNKVQYAMILQIRTFSSKRIINLHGNIDNKSLLDIKSKIKDLYNL